MNYKPDFLIKPYEVHAHPGLRPSDSDVYAVVYWFEKMRGEKCTAGNDTIAEVARLQVRTVRAALERLEKFGFIERIYVDALKKNRLEIITKVHMTASAPKTTPPPVYKAKKGAKITKEVMTPGAIVKVDAPEEPTEQSALETILPKEPTPGEIARDFFLKESKYRIGIIDEIASSTGAQRDALVAEIKKFYTYWTEPNKSGTKARWEMERTFEVKRRLFTWLQRANLYKNNTDTKARTGSGATI